MSGRHEMQAAGTHPAPCARHCEATAFQIEIRRLSSCLSKANEQAEHFEREWYLRGDELEQLRAELDASREQFSKAAAAFEREQDRALAEEVRAEAAETALTASREREARMRGIGGRHYQLIKDDDSALKEKE